MGLVLLSFVAGAAAVVALVGVPGGDNRDAGGLSPFAAAPARQEQPSPAASLGGSGRGPVPVPGAPGGADGGSPSAVDSPRLALVVDDFGYDPTRDAEWLVFPEKITVAVIPFGPSSRRIAQAARARGFGVVIHVPMEPEGAVQDRTAGFLLRRGMEARQIDALVGRMAAEIPEATGVSNHMGSAFTSDPAAMDAFAAAIKSRSLFFLDSVTSPRSVAYESARRAGVPALRRDVYLDALGGTQEMRKQWERAVVLAREKGGAVVVCHARPQTLALARELAAGLSRAGVRAVTLDELLAASPG